jgi:predicted Rossmann fold nucleotide-binding protein DprA/Smf involved in DNA uptake
MTVKSSIMIAGSRDVDREVARTLFEQQLSPFLSQGRTWLVGTARGIDHWAMEWLLENTESCWAVVPYTRFKQPQWVQSWLEQLDRVVELQLPKRKTASAIRNRHMVDLAGIVFGFWSGKGGGTIKTLKYALRQRREVHAIPVTRDTDEAAPWTERAQRQASFLYLGSTNAEPGAVATWFKVECGQRPSMKTNTERER